MSGKRKKTTKEEAGLDKEGAAPKKPPTVRLARTAQLVARNPGMPLGAAMKAAGYSPWTARTPTQSGVTVATLAAALPAKSRDTLAGLRPAAIRRLRRLLEDDHEASGVAGASAIATLKLLSEVGGDEPEPVPDAAHDAALAVRCRNVLRWLSLGVDCPERAREMLEVVRGIEERALRRALCHPPAEAPRPRFAG